MKPVTKFVLAVVLLVPGLLAGCGRAQSGQPQPPEILYGQDLCESCGMLIDQPQFAAATVTLDGAAHRFDAVAEMVAYHAEHPLEQVQAWFVHDYHNEAWIRAETGYFVHSEAIIGPMGHGIAAFANQAEADALAVEVGASVVSFDELRAELAASAHEAH
jgi:copper chaperone NosL